MKKLYLVDVSSMFFRAFFAIPPLTNSAGLPTNALYGFLAMSIKLLRESKPDYMAFCFDRPEPSFRLELYEDYKANRSELPDDLEPQLPYVRQLTDELGIVAVDKVKYEADDIIGTLAKLGEKEGLEVTIVSGDKDFAQLVSPHVSLLDTMKNIRYDREGVIAKWGVPPEQIIDYLAIVGDSSDNIPGVRGIGPKGALKLLAEYGSLDGIYKKIDSVKPDGMKAKLIESKKSAYLAQKLVTIDTDVDLKLKISDLTLKTIDKEKLKATLDMLEFGALSRKIFGDPSAAAADGDLSESGSGVSARKSSSKPTSKTKALAPKKSAGPLVVTGESIKLNHESMSLPDFLKHVQPYEELWVASNERGVVFGHGTDAIQVNAELAHIGEALKDKRIQWKGFDLKSAWTKLKLQGDHTVVWDTMLAAYVAKAGSTEDFAKVYKSYTGKDLPELCGVEDQLSCDMELSRLVEKRLEETGNAKVLHDLELPMVPVLYRMEREGVLIDTDELKKQSASLAKDIAAAEKEIHRLAGESFNIGSPKQLGAVLFEKLKIPVVKKTKTGYSTDSDVLSKLAGQYPICNYIIEYRELSKLKSTYVDALPLLVDPVDKRIHTNFHQAVTATGRLSSKDPNLQNIPIRTERGRMIRKAFIAKPDHYFLSVDYSQIELRVLAELTGDPGLIDAFSRNVDVHAATASEIFDVPLDEVTPEHRRKAKAVNFGIAYGQGVYGLAETLEIPHAEAKGIIENYFRKFSKVKDFMLDTVNVAKEQGYVETLFGRRRYIDEFKSSNHAVQKFGERAAMNAPLQGTASDLMKLAMIKIDETVSSRMILQVHDELVFEVPKDTVEQDAQEIRELMEKAAPSFKVPLVANVAWGDNWEDAH